MCLFDVLFNDRKAIFSVSRFVPLNFKFFRNKVIYYLCILTSVASQNAVSAETFIPSLELQGHRGARGLAPENTLPAFHLAYHYGMTTIELDTTLTADGHLIVHHDTHMNTQLCILSAEEQTHSRPILSFTLQALQGLDCGSLPNPRFPNQVRQKAHPPTISEVIALEDLWSAKPLYNIEIKTDALHSDEHKRQAVEALGQELSSLVKEHESLWSRVTLQSFDFEILKLARSILPKVRRSALFEPMIDRSVNPPTVVIGDERVMIEAARKLKVNVISPYHVTVTKALIAGAHSEGIKVIPWTVNEPNRMRHLIALGVDGIISDYPDRLAKLVTLLGTNVECRTRHRDAQCLEPIKTFVDRSSWSPLIDLKDVDDSIEVEMRYARRENFLGRPVIGYQAERCLLTKPAAKALSRAQKALQESDLSLKVYDCYRPQRSVDDFVRWAKNLRDQKMKGRYYPDVDKSELFRRGYIAKRSGHSRGSTVDLTINGLDMGTEWDFFGVESHTLYPHHSIEIRAHRALLTHIMKAHGFVNYEREWWHFTLSSEPIPALYFDHKID